MVVRTVRFLLILLLLEPISACNETTNNPEDAGETMQTMSTSSNLLAPQIESLEYSKLFRDTNHENELNMAWGRASQNVFEELVDDTTATAKARFLASELLLKKDLTYLSRVNLTSLTEVYIKAMLGNYSGDMTDWGFLTENDDTGVLGTMFLTFGEKAVPALMELLDDERVVEYERNSADSGFNMTLFLNVRVKDLAALHISTIEKHPMTFDVLIEERDQEIERLKLYVTENHNE